MFVVVPVRTVVAISYEPTTVGATYYGGHYDDSKQTWVISNENECNAIASGRYTAASLNAITAPKCDDDNGLGYINDIPLHNTVSFAELSTIPSRPDYSALGNLAAGTKVQIRYAGRCVVAEKRDVGLGGGPVNGHVRAIDLWWQTARSLGFTNGFDTVSVQLVAPDTPLSLLGHTSACISVAPQSQLSAPQSATSPAPVQPAPTVAPDALPQTESSIQPQNIEELDQQSVMGDSGQRTVQPTSKHLSPIIIASIAGIIAVLGFIVFMIARKTRFRSFMMRHKKTTSPQDKQ